MAKRTRRAARAPASSNLTTSKKRYTLGSGREGTPKASRRGAPLLVPLMSRLRRLEVIVLHLNGKLPLGDDMLEKMLDSILVMRNDTTDIGDKSGN